MRPHGSGGSAVDESSWQRWLNKDHAMGIFSGGLPGSKAHKPFAAVSNYLDSTLQELWPLRWRPGPLRRDARYGAMGRAGRLFYPFWADGFQ